jgi:biopolymer transport protein ExbB
VNLGDAFLQLTLIGAVLWLLVLLSVVSVAVMIERWRFFAARKIAVAELITDLRSALAAGGDIAGARRKYERSLAMPAVVTMRGLAETARGVDVVAESMNGAKTQARAEHEANLVFLGTLGNNAPFIGLFGTVLGIIEAFAELAKNKGDDTMVMRGISEALVATAAGLLVAIPAVVMFNYFNRRVRAAVTATDSAAHAVLAELHAWGATRSPGRPSADN